MVATRSSFDESSPSTSGPSGPPNEVRVETVANMDDASITSHADNASIASAPNPISVVQGLGARFRARNGPTPKKVAFDTVAWLTHKALGPRAGSQGTDGTGDRVESQPEDGRPANGVNGSESASGFRAPAHTNTPAAGENLAPNPRDAAQSDSLQDWIYI